jgi:hypothetical protein
MKKSRKRHAKSQTGEASARDRGRIVAMAIELLKDPDPRRRKFNKAYLKETLRFLSKCRLGATGGKFDLTAN